MATLGYPNPFDPGNPLYRMLNPPRPMMQQAPPFGAPAGMGFGASRPGGVDTGGPPPGALPPPNPAATQLSPSAANYSPGVVQRSMPVREPKRVVEDLLRGQGLNIHNPNAFVSALMNRIPEMNARAITEGVQSMGDRWFAEPDAQSAGLQAVVRRALSGAGDVFGGGGMDTALNILNDLGQRGWMTGASPGAQAAAELLDDPMVVANLVASRYSGMPRELAALVAAPLRDLPEARQRAMQGDREFGQYGPTDTALSYLLRGAPRIPLYGSFY